MYIAAASTISHQPTFRNKGFSSQLVALSKPSTILHPEYSDIISAISLRRMSDVLTMAIACASDCLKQSDIEQPEAIVVGTGMGCNFFTKSFLDKIIAAEGRALSPTSFILSTHNTIAGQIALLLKNYNYNTTHTQNSLSFEQALIDAVLCIHEGYANVLVGAADETENVLYNLNARLNTHDIHAACGASFFILAAEKPISPAIELIDVGSFGLIHDRAAIIAEFLDENKLTAADIDLVLYSCSDQETVADLRVLFDPGKLLDYQKISGAYFTNSAFAMHYGLDFLVQKIQAVSGGLQRRILICNNLIPENLGLIFLATQ
jgi:hypothetical protein